MYLQKLREASYLISLKKIHPKIFLEHYPSCANDLKKMMDEMECVLGSHTYTGNTEKIINRGKKLGIILNDKNKGIVSSHKDLKKLSHTYDSIIREVTTNITAIGSVRSQYGYNLMDKDIEEMVNKIVRSSQSIQARFDNAISSLNRGGTPHRLGSLRAKVDNFRTLAEELEQFSKLYSDSGGVSLETNTQADASHLTTTPTGIESTQSLTAIYKKHTIERWLQDTSKESDTPD